jgi:tetratricopeptide (TPR) repeat protein
MVDLLSTNLDAVGGIRTIDPRVVLNRWRDRTGGGELSLDGDLAVGRDVDAGSVLTGTVVEAGSQVRLSAALHDIGGSELARVQIDGSADNLLALVDTLSLRLLRATWRSRDPLPSVSVSGLTTGSLDAIRAYLKGAAFYRRAEFDSAVAAFGRAVEFDSTFALAHAQQAMAMGWLQGFGTPNAAQSVRKAMAFAHRLPERDRSMVTAYDLFIDNRMAALDTMRAYVTRYPSDAVGWHLLGDMQAHSMHLTGLTPEQYLAPFERSLELDSSFSPAMVHPMDIAYQILDSALFYQYLNLFDAQDASVARYRDMARLAWAPDTAAARRALQDIIEGSPIALASALPAVSRMRDDIRNVAMSVLDTAVTLDGPVSGELIVRALSHGSLLMATGRLDAMRNLARGLIERDVNPLRSIGTMLLFQPILAGYVDTTFAGAYMAEIRNVSSPLTLFIRAQLALRHERTEEARRVLNSITPPTVGEGAFQINFGTLYRAAGAWADLIDGDTTAVTAMLDAFEDFGLVFSGVTSGTGVMRVEAATALASRARTREDGLRRLEYGFFSDVELLPLAHLRRAQVLEQNGDREGAALALADFIDLWKNADPDLQPRVEDARGRLERLSGEPAR